jgi:hypothetical protein
MELEPNGPVQQQELQKSKPLPPPLRRPAVPLPTGPQGPQGPRPSFPTSSDIVRDTLGIRQRAQETPQEKTDRQARLEASPHYQNWKKWREDRIGRDRQEKERRAKMSQQQRDSEDHYIKFKSGPNSDQGNGKPVLNPPNVAPRRRPKESFADKYKRAPTALKIAHTVINPITGIPMQIAAHRKEIKRGFQRFGRGIKNIGKRAIGGIAGAFKWKKR